MIATGSQVFTARAPSFLSSAIRGLSTVLKLKNPPRVRIAISSADAVPEDLPADERVRLVPLDKLPAESVLEVRTDSGVTLVFCDAILNMPKLGFPMGFFLGPTGRVSVPRVVRVIALKDKRALARQLEGLAATPGLERVLFGHGKPITDDPAGALRSVVAQLA